MSGTGWRSVFACSIRRTKGATQHRSRRSEDRMDKDMSAPRTLAGIAIPDTLLVDEAMDYARKACEPYLFNHVVRSWLFAARIGELQGIAHDAEVLAVGTLLHDITLNKHFAGPRRFEVEGADLARTFATERGLAE